MPVLFRQNKAKQRVLLVTGENNRLKPAKSAYHCITDTENFSEVDAVFRYRKRRDEPNDFTGTRQDCPSGDSVTAKRPCGNSCMPFR